jgi:Dolichyl-phosphate-mannose-protein mannosyltransferase
VNAPAAGRRPRRWDLWLIGIVAVGVALRALQLFGGASLSSDEAMLALNVLHRSYGGLTDRLDFNQAAPLGLLALEKLAAEVGGGRDLALRLVPFAAGVSALVLFPLLARRVLASRWAVLVATALFAVSDPLVYWTGTDKQYAVDVCVAVVLPLLALRCLDGGRGRRVALGLACVVAPLVSHPSAFVIAAALCALFLGSPLRAARGELVAIAVAAAASFGVAYEIEKSGLHGIQSSLRGTPGAFVEATHIGLASTILGVFRYLAGIPVLLPHGSRDLGELISALALVLVAAGIVGVTRRAPVAAGTVVGPLFFLAAASSLGLYPLLSRTVLFLLPGLALMLGGGIVALARVDRRAVSVLALLAGAAVASVWSSDTVKHLGSTRTRQQIEPVLTYLARHEQRSDGLYVYFKAQYGFRFYLDCACSSGSVRTARRAGLWPLRAGAGGSAQWAPALATTDPGRLLVGHDLGDAAGSYAADVSRLRARRRVWVVLSDIPNGSREEILAALDRVAKRRVAYQSGDDESAARAYLYVFA